MRKQIAVIIAALLAAPCDASISVITGAVGEQGVTTSVNASPALNTQLHDTIWVAFSARGPCSGYGAITISDTAGDTFVIVGSTQTSGWSGNACIGQYYVKDAAASASNTVSVSVGTNTNRFGITVLQARGVDNTSPLDQSFTNDGNPGSQVTRQTPVFTPTSANELWVVGTVSESNVTQSAGTCNAANCTLTPTSTGSGPMTANEYFISSSIVSNSSMTFVFGSSANGMLKGATFKQATGGGAVYPAALINSLQIR